jgi:hypothetical protein
MFIILRGFKCFTMTWAQQVCYRPRLRTTSTLEYSSAFLKRNPDWVAGVIPCCYLTVLIVRQLLSWYFSTVSSLEDTYLNTPSSITCNGAQSHCVTLLSSLWPIYMIWSLRWVYTFTCYNQLLEFRKRINSCGYCVDLSGHIPFWNPSYSLPDGVCDKLVM